MSPDNAWMALQGIETLPMRMEKHCENAMKTATHLSKHPKVAWVRYPGLGRDPMNKLQKKYLQGKGGPLVVIGLKGGREAGEKMINSLKLFSHALASVENPETRARRLVSLPASRARTISARTPQVANVGDAKSLAIHPASTPHSQLSDEEQIESGLAPELVRLSVGIEHIDDILIDLDQALAQVE